jgi:hydroxylaminobenzene mutase
MSSAKPPAQVGQRLIQAGALLFLAGLIVGFAVPRFAVPRLGLSVHLLGITQGLFLMVAGLVWPRLDLTRRLSLLGMGLAAYGCLAAWTANLLAALWGAGSHLLPLAAGQAQGSPVQEAVIAIGLRTAAISLVAALMVMLWGLRASAGKPADN